MTVSFHRVEGYMICFVLSSFGLFWFSFFTFCGNTNKGSGLMGTSVIIWSESQIGYMDCSVLYYFAILE